MSRFLYEVDDEKFEELAEDKFADNKDVSEEFPFSYSVAAERNI